MLTTIKTKEDFQTWKTELFHSWGTQEWEGRELREYSLGPQYNFLVSLIKQTNPPPLSSYANPLKNEEEIQSIKTKGDGVTVDRAAGFLVGGLWGYAVAEVLTKDAKQLANRCERMMLVWSVICAIGLEKFKTLPRLGEIKGINIRVEAVTAPLMVGYITPKKEGNEVKVIIAVRAKDPGCEKIRTLIFSLVEQKSIWNGRSAIGGTIGGFFYLGIVRFCDRPNYCKFLDFIKGVADTI